MERNPAPADSPEATRGKILATAKTLVQRHGGHKLTVVEIARELGMSHANVYRYYKSKAKILDAIVDEWMTRLNAFMESIAQRRAPAAVRIEALVLELYLARADKCRKEPEIYVTYQRVMDLRPEAVEQRQATIRRVLVRLLDEGIRAGEFAPMDTQVGAVLIQDTTALFLHPLLSPLAVGPRAKLRAQTTVRHLLAGFAAPRPAKVRSRT